MDIFAARLRHKKPSLSVILFAEDQADAARNIRDLLEEE